MKILPSGMRSYFPPSMPSASQELQDDIGHGEKKFSNRLKIDSFSTLAMGALGGAAAYSLLPAKAMQPAAKTPWMLWITAASTSVLTVGHMVWQAFDRKNVVDPLKSQVSAFTKQLGEMHDQLSIFEGEMPHQATTLEGLRRTNDYWTIETANLKDRLDDLGGIVRRFLPVAPSVDRAKIQADLATLFPVAVKKASRRGTNVSFASQ